MKKAILLGVTVFSLLFISQARLSAQATCPGCVVNTSCFVPGGGLCPDSIPAGIQGQYYDEDVTAYLPSVIDAAPFSGGVLGIVPLLSVHLDNITGLPFGLSWTSDHPGNNFLPASGDTLGCIKICGVPISAPGIYNIVITVTAGVDAGALGTQYAQTSFNLQMMLLANTSGNYAFNYTPSSGCDSATVTFTPNITGSLPQIVGYNWDFNGNVVSTLNPPAPQTFSGPGAYPVTLTTNIYALTLTDANTTANGDWWTGDIEETCIISCPDPDLYFRFTHGSNTYISSSGSDNTSNSWSGLNVVMTGSTVAFAVWDADTGPPFGSADDDGGTYTTNITAPGVYPYTTTTPYSGYTGGSGGDFTIAVTLDTSITVTDTIFVYPSPPPATLQGSILDFCPGDSVMLEVDSGYSYEWFLDSALLTTNTTHNFWTNQPGNYYVTIYDTNGCYNNSNSVTVNQFPGIPFNFGIVWNSTNMNMESNISGSYTYQWMYYNGSSWVNIAPPEGTQSSYTPLANGQYQLIVTDQNGCIDTSAVYDFNSLGIHTNLDLEYGINLYPNPTSGEFTISMNLPSEMDMQVRIFDLLGKEVYTKDMPHVSGYVNQFFTLYDLKAGTYLVDITFPEGTVRRKLIVH